MDESQLLTPKDKELIFQQCQNQGATAPEKIVEFAVCYAWAKNLIITGIIKLGLSNPMDQAVEEAILCWAGAIDPRNVSYRRIPVTFANGNKGLAPELIERAMWGFCFRYAHGQYQPDEAYKEFERIHPFVDGNGRVGHLLWAMLKWHWEKVWPETLPPEPDWTK